MKVETHCLCPWCTLVRRIRLQALLRLYNVSYGKPVAYRVSQEERCMIGHPEIPCRVAFLLMQLTPAQGLLLVASEIWFCQFVEKSSISYGQTSIWHVHRTWLYKISQNVNSIIYSNCQAIQTFISDRPGYSHLEGKEKWSEGFLTSVCSEEDLINSRLGEAGESIWTVHVPYQEVAVLERPRESPLPRMHLAHLPVLSLCSMDVAVCLGDCAISTVFLLKQRIAY